MCDMTDMNSLVEQIVQRIADVYHMTQESAENAFRKSRFISVLNDLERGYAKDDAETNFRRYQNEIEYGAWNRNEFGEIVE